MLALLALLALLAWEVLAMVDSEPGRWSEDAAGTWVRGADGFLYFIPDEDMEAFRVPEREAASTPEGSDELASGGGAYEPGKDEGVEPLPALRGPAALRDLELRGPFALKDLMQGPAAIVPPAITLRGLRDVE
jgi:hypothetical protein